MKFNKSRGLFLPEIKPLTPKIQSQKLLPLTTVQYISNMHYKPMPSLKLRDTSVLPIESNRSQQTQNFLRTVKAHRLTVCQKQLSGYTYGNAVYTIMAAGLHFGLAHFEISPAPQTEEIETSSTGGQHLLCREMQMETMSSL